MKKKKKKKDIVPLLLRNGETYDPPAIDVCSKMCVSLPEFKNLSTHTSTFSHLNSSIAICSDAESLEAVKILILLHFPGDTNPEKLKEFSWLWKTGNEFVREPYNRFILAIINKVIFAATGKKILSPRRALLLRTFSYVSSTKQMQQR